MTASVSLVIGFGSSSALAGAYGVAVAATMVITTLLFAVVCRQRWGWSATTTYGLGAALLAVDGAFFAANLAKIPAGGWFPLVVGLLLLTLMMT